MFSSGRLLRRVTEKNWFVYAKPPFAGPEAVLALSLREFGIFLWRGIDSSQTRRWRDMDSNHWSRVKRNGRSRRAISARGCTGSEWSPLVLCGRNMPPTRAAGAIFAIWVSGLACRRARTSWHTRAAGIFIINVLVRRTRWRPTSHSRRNSRPSVAASAAYLSIDPCGRIQ
jgi:hypothetical protein